MATYQLVLTSTWTSSSLSEVATTRQTDSAAYKLKPRSFHKSTHLWVHLVDFHPSVNCAWQLFNTSNLFEGIGIDLPFSPISTITDVDVPKTFTKLLVYFFLTNKCFSRIWYRQCLINLWIRWKLDNLWVLIDLTCLTFYQVPIMIMKLFTINWSLSL